MQGPSAVITCYLEYQIDPYKLKEFRQYAEMWLPLVEKFGGRIRVECPTEGGTVVTISLPADRYLTEAV